MDTMTLPRCSAHSIAAGLLLEALGAHDTHDHVRVEGLPGTAVLVPEREALVATTAAAWPMFADQLEPIAVQHRLDVVLLRICAAGGDAPVGMDFALGSLPCAVWAETAYALYRDQAGVWLVPERFGPAVSVGCDGFCLEIVPPYPTLADRHRGVVWAARDLARLLQPLTVR
ncbi:hypothetical protein CA236_04150 [Sphingomonas sp. ABOLG]|nr:hypothetical protein CA236_04150 [Sphingomonas sp. ABOLG]